MTMQLRVLLPTRVLVQADARTITAEGQHGRFTLLPRHVDVVVALVTGLLSWETDGVEAFAALDGGLLIKRGSEVTIGTRRAVLGPALGTLRRTIEQEFAVRDEREQAARGAMARLEVDFIHRFLEMEKHGDA